MKLVNYCLTDLFCSGASASSARNAKASTKSCHTCVRHMEGNGRKQLQQTFRSIHAKPDAETRGRCDSVVETNHVQGKVHSLVQSLTSIVWVLSDWLRI